MYFIYFLKIFVGAGLNALVSTSGEKNPYLSHQKIEMTLPLWTKMVGKVFFPARVGTFSL